MRVTINNFHEATKASWKACKTPNRLPDYVSYDRKGKVSSSYWYNEEEGYVIRQSDHWSGYRYRSQGIVESYIGDCRKVASCNWEIYFPCERLMESYEGNKATGKCYLKDFHSNSTSDRYKKRSK
jgi:hypothetical protein